MSIQQNSCLHLPSSGIPDKTTPSSSLLFSKAVFSIELLSGCFSLYSSSIALSRGQKNGIALWVTDHRLNVICFVLARIVICEHDQIQKAGTKGWQNWPGGKKKGALGPLLHSAEAKLRGPMLGLTPVQDLEFRLWVL